MKELGVLADKMSIMCSSVPCNLIFLLDRLDN
jgi:hypothetical protein